MRKRQMATGRARLPASPPQFWLWTLVIFAAFAGIYWWVSESKLSSAKSRTLARQRAMSQTLGTKLIPFRDSVEGWTLELAKQPWLGNEVADGADLALIQSEPAVYLRLRMENAKDGKSLRKAAQNSLRDGFTTCFFRQKDGVDPRKGLACKVQADCESGYLCNEWDVCTRPVQPYNLRLAFRALRVLSNEWSDEVNQAGSELALRIYDRDLDRTTKEDVPIAAEVLERARFLTVVLDEDPPAGLPKPAYDAGPDEPDETDEERIRRSQHFARVGIWDLKSKQRVFTYRAEATGRLLPVGGGKATDVRTQAAQERQSNSCALALGVKAQFSAGQAPAPGVPDAGDAGVPSDAGAPGDAGPGKAP
ncbi:MAG: hypothetical protein H6718_32720 [Polyangiaceae bacterium]|nr:hypothetical protein [Polyangiaceae bacterium]